MKRRFSHLTDPGLVRLYNQDYFYSDPDGRFFIVADGMGGHAGGEEASKIATKEIRSYLEEHWNSEQSPSLILKEALYKANDGILADQLKHPERGDMGTTVVVLLFRDQESWCAHVGDSRLYRLRNSFLEQLTEDHTWVAKSVRDGDITKEEARVHQLRHILSQCLGRKEIYQIDIGPIEVKPGDQFLLCSDGLTEEVPDETLQEIFTSIDSLDQMAETMVIKAKEAGGSDNITLILVAQD